MVSCGDKPWELLSNLAFKLLRLFAHRFGFSWSANLLIWEMRDRFMIADSQLPVLFGLQVRSLRSSHEQSLQRCWWRTGCTPGLKPGLSVSLPFRNIINRRLLIRIIWPFPAEGAASCILCCYTEEDGLTDGLTSCGSGVVSTSMKPNHRSHHCRWI